MQTIMKTRSSKLVRLLSVLCLAVWAAGSRAGAQEAPVLGKGSVLEGVGPRKVTQGAEHPPHLFHDVRHCLLQCRRH